jgi:hypothetical protein
VIRSRRRGEAPTGFSHRSERSPRAPAPSSCPYSPKCVEGEFSEVRELLAAPLVAAGAARVGELATFRRQEAPLVALRAQR